LSAEVEVCMTGARRTRRIPKSFLERAAYSFLLIAVVVLLGTVAMHSIEGWSYLDSFYFTSMIATGQGPPANLDPQSASGKVFTAILAFVSVGTVISALLFLFGPFFGRVFRLSVERIEDVEKERERKAQGAEPRGH
jgi:hypothetical protein